MRLDHLLSKESEVFVLCYVFINSALCAGFCSQCKAREGKRSGAYLRKRSIPEYVSIGSTERQRSNVDKRQVHGGLAQLGEHLLCTQGVKSSNLLISTIAYESKYEAVKFTKSKILEFVA